MAAAEGGEPSADVGIRSCPSNSGAWVGRRVRVAEHVGSIRWGPGKLLAPPSKRPTEPGAPPPEIEILEVVGVEYDEAGVGKHDGTHQGTRLFTCPDGFGSFVKVEKAELAIPVQQALAEKYFAAQTASKGTRAETVDAVDYIDSKGREKAMTVELVGRYDLEKRQQRLESFMEIALAETRVGWRYPDTVWQGDWSLPNLKSLWLDKTLISQWSDVAAICELCPSLEWLSLARTRLASPPPGLEPLPVPQDAPTGGPMRLVLKPFVCQVKTLILNQSLVSWSDVLALDAKGVFPMLEHLHLAQNNLTEGIPADLGLSTEGPGRRPLQRLRSIVLDGNGISDWTVLRRAITAFPALEALHLNANLLGKTLEGLASVAADQTPRCLTALFLNENQLATWQAVGALSGYALLELKVQRIPLTEGDSPLASPMLLRQILIALMPMLLRLNSSEVTVKERTAAERYFMSLAQQKESRLVQALSETCDLRWHVARLQKIHGDVVCSDVTEDAQATRSALFNALVEVTLRPVGAAIVEQAVIKKKVPHTMTVAEMRKLAQVLFKKVPLERVRLVLADDGLPFGVPLDIDERELGFFGVSDGAEIRVDDSSDTTFTKTC